MERREAIQAAGLAMLPLVLGARSARAASTGATADATTGATTPSMWLHGTLQYGHLARVTSNEVLAKSQVALVREFAHLEIIEQTAAAEALTGMANPPPPALTAEESGLLAIFRASSTPDYSYVSLQITAHERLLQLQSGYLRDLAGHGSDNIHVAILLRSNIEQHLRLLKTNLVPAVRG